MTPPQAIHYLLGRAVDPKHHVSDLIAAARQAKRHLDESTKVKEALAVVILALIHNHDHDDIHPGLSFRDIERLTGIPRSTASDLAAAARRARDAAAEAAINAANGDKG